MMSAALTCKINFYVVWIVLCSCISPCQSHAILSPSYGFRLFNIKGGVSTKVKHPKTANEFDNLIWGHQEDLVVVDFSASWCGPCKMIGPLYDQLSLDRKHKNILFVKVDIDQNPDIAARYQIKSMPTFVFMKNRREIDRFSGADILKVKDYIRRLS